MCACVCVWYSVDLARKRMQMATTKTFLQLDNQIPAVHQKPRLPLPSAACIPQYKSHTCLPFTVACKVQFTLPFSLPPLTECKRLDSVHREGWLSGAALVKGCRVMPKVVFSNQISLGNAGLKGLLIAGLLCVFNLPIGLRNL